ncbi:MAG: hypothetical protein Q9M13_03270, partial [Mariprofundales bacterium]|nr:hypothetical protein [Mariprofundales bacterium]
IVPPLRWLIVWLSVAHASENRCVMQQLPGAVAVYCNSIDLMIMASQEVITAPMDGLFAMGSMM